MATHVDPHMVTRRPAEWPRTGRIQWRQLHGGYKADSMAAVRRRLRPVVMMGWEKGRDRGGGWGGDRGRSGRGAEASGGDLLDVRE